MSDNRRVCLFSDGSCGAGPAGSGDIGAWAALLVGPHSRQLLYGVVNPTTISRMELTPIIESLIWLKKNWCAYLKKTRVSVYSDSEYVVKTMSGAYTPHKNMDLWGAFDLVRQDFDLTFTWYGRNSLNYMSACDSICSTMRLVLKDASNKLFNDYKRAADALPYAELPKDNI